MAFSCERPWVVSSDGYMKMFPVLKCISRSERSQCAKALHTFTCS